ncbi:MAG: site-2 protease family protein [Micromonosporaceae bacterium]|nr:site-2 protease family protein [Micromonosporaceae bacterium]
MLYVLGLVAFALGILIAVSLHEAGHMVSAKAFGMKVTRYFVGFGPTLWSFRKGETEYGVKAIPLGGFCKIVGMTPQDDDVAPEDEPRAMWRFPVWKRTIVMAAGSVTHFVLGFVVLWGVFAFAALPDEHKWNTTPPVVKEVSACVPLTWQVDPDTGELRDCDPDQSQASPASKIGLRAGDTITAIDGRPATGWDQVTDQIRAAANKTITVTYTRDGTAITKSVFVPAAERPREDLDPTTPVAEVTKDDLEQVGVLGITSVVPTSTAGPIGAFGQAGTFTGEMFQRTFIAIKQVPQRIPALWDALTGAPRDPNTPMSVVGASRLGGELAQHGLWEQALFIYASLNFFIGVFNLLPLLPLDGGHIGIAWFERGRSWLYARIGRRDPGRVDYFKLMPITYLVILIGGGFTLLTVAADIVNPITLFGR